MIFEAITILETGEWIVANAVEEFLAPLVVANRERRKRCDLVEDVEFMWCEQSGMIEVHNNRAGDHVVPSEQRRRPSGVQIGIDVRAMMLSIKAGCRELGHDDL